MITFRTGRKIPARADLHAVGVCSGDDAERPEGLDWGVLNGRGFEGKAGRVEIVSGGDRPVAVVGLGPADKITTAVIRRAAGSLARSAKRMRRITVSVLDAVPDSVDRSEALRSLAEGMTLGAYSYGEFKSEHKPNKLETVIIIGPGGGAVAEALERGRRVAEAVCFARDLVNEPGGSLTPTRFAEIAEEMAEQEGLEVSVLDLDGIRKAELGGLLGVNRGSEQPPGSWRCPIPPTRTPSAGGRWRWLARV